ncbi:MAG: coproporphyrinogen dehydrogenase HemZ [Clostridia bacterium]|nr:coproporphyrinogen dehydrogenase HemZ [Clostridia bacterium]
MKLNIYNSTGLLNNYYFQTLSLLYFPGEKFPTGVDLSPNSADYYLEKRGDGYYGKAVLRAGEYSAEGEFCTDGYIFSVPVHDELNAQCAIGKAMVQAGEKLFGFSLPWGYITGLRPVKRARYYLDRGYDDETVKSLFINDHNVSPEKTELSIRTAHNEIRMLEGVGGKTAGLYISIPFCPTRCQYCSFVSYSTPRLLKMLPDYVELLIKDIKDTASVLGEIGVKLSAIYVGGGTPSILSPEHTRRVLGTVTENFDLSSLREFTFEAGRPDTITADKLYAAKESGVTRVSINPQSLNENVLRAIGRQHTTAQFFEAYDIARKVGFDSINADLIAGLPEDTFDTFASSFEKVLSMGFENITLHTLSIKNAAAMRFEKENVYDPAGKLAISCVQYVYDRMMESGMKPYYLYRQKNTVGNAENTGYSVPGKENLYNILMMEEHSSVFACGAGAITKLVTPDEEIIDRIAHQKYPYEYLAEPKGIGADRIKEFYFEHFND